LICRPAEELDVISSLTSQQQLIALTGKAYTRGEKLALLLVLLKQ
jgi:hypothetical protein